MYAFLDCYSLESITVPCSIEHDAFSDCINLKSITLEEGVTYIDEDAFDHCNSLTEITIPDSLKWIGAFAFGSGFDKVYINSLSSWLNIKTVNLSSNPHGDLYLNGELLTDVVIPDDVTNIRYGAFSSCKSLKSVTIHDNVADIAEKAFIYCNEKYSKLFN